MKQAGLTIGIDLGGTKIAGGLIGIDGTVLASARVPTPRTGRAAVVAALADMVSTLKTETGASVSVIGVGVPGVLDVAAGTTLLMVNVPGEWENAPLAEEVQEIVGLPVRLINDARAYTLAEWTFGAGEQHKGTVVLIAPGTGVGGGVVINGTLHLGASGIAGEIGHLIVEPDGPACGCGNHGCLESIAGGWGIAARGVDALTTGSAPILAELVNKEPARVTAELVFAAAEAGDRGAEAIVARAARALGITLANLVTLLAPDLLIVGGGIVEGSPAFMAGIERVFAERFTMRVLRTRIVRARLGATAGVLGAAAWARTPLS